MALSDAAASGPTFTAPSDAAAVSESLSFSLKVSDPHGVSDTDAVTVTAQNQLPTADAGDDQSVAKGASVTLDGSGSSDPEGGALTYAWRQTGGTTVTLSSATAASPTFTAPSVDGTLTFSLTVTDPQGLTGTDTATVTVENQAPIAVVPDQSVAKGAAVTLDGSGSSDPEGGALTYSWRQTGGTTVTLSSATAASPTFTAPSVDGTLTFSLTVTDPQGLSGMDTGTVTVASRYTLTVNKSPAAGGTVTGVKVGSTTKIIDCGTDCSETVNSGTEVTLTASPAASYIVQAWSGGNCSGDGGTCEVKVNADTTVSVTFGKPILTISPVPTNGHVTGNGINCGAGGRTVCSATLNAGTAVSLSATEGDDHWFKAWTGVDDCSGKTCAFSILANTTVGADFQPYDYIYRLSGNPPAAAPAAPSGGTTEELHVPTDWQRAKLSPTVTQSVWRAQRKRTYDNNGRFSSATAWGEVERIGWMDVDYLYKTVWPLPRPTGGESSETHVPAHWTRTEPTAERGKPVWRIKRERTYNSDGFSSATAWHGSERVGYVDADYVYKKAVSQPAAPSGGESKEAHAPSSPRGWTRTEPDAEQGKPVWRAKRDRTYNSGGFASATAWGNVEKVGYVDWDSVYKKAASKPAAPSGAANLETHTPDGWTRTEPDAEQGKPVWRAWRKRTYNSDGFASAAAWGDVDKPGWVDVDYIYKRAASEPDAPPGGTTRNATHKPSGWTRTIPEPTLTESVWRAERQRTYKSGRIRSATDWSKVKKYCYLSEEKDYVYKKSATKPTTPSGGADNKMYTPSGWSRTVPEPTLTESVWRAERTLTFKHTLKSNGFDYDKKVKPPTTEWTVKNYCYLTQEQDYIYKKSATKPPVPIGGENLETHTPSGWSRTAPEATLTESVWRAERTLTYKHTLKSDGSYSKVFQPPATSWGNVVKYSCLTQAADYIYKKSATKPPVPIGGENSETHTPSGWSRTAPEPTLTESVWRAQRSLTYKCARKSDGTGYDEAFQPPATAWSSVTEYSWAELDYIYKLAATAPSAPSGGTKTENHEPSGWQRKQPAPTATKNVYRAERTEYYENDLFDDKASAWDNVTKIGDKLTVDPGGTNGTYTAIRFRGGDDGDYNTPFYVANVEATASGGTSPYAFRWHQDKDAGTTSSTASSTASSTETFWFVWSGTYTRFVTVTDANKHQKTATITIHCNPSSGVGGASDGDRHRVPVPLGGTLVAIWGHGGPVSASSKNTGVASATGSGDEIRVTGVSAGETDIVVQAGGSEYHVPIQVGGG